MKKLLFLSLILFFIVSCDSIEEQEQAYNNPVEGQWDVLSDSGTILHTRVYTKQYYAYFSVIDGEVQYNIDSLHYEVSGNNLIFDRYQQTFLISADSLLITNSKGDQQTKYVRKKNLN